jgi:hypothetical protein
LHELPSGRAAICNGSKQDAGFRNMVAQYEKASGNTIDVSIVPIAPDAAEDRLGSDRPRPDGRLQRRA